MVYHLSHRGSLHTERPGSETVAPAGDLATEPELTPFTRPVTQPEPEKKPDSSLALKAQVAKAITFRN